MGRAGRLARFVHVADVRKKVAILGSTGSMGTQTLDVIARHPERFEVAALAAGKCVAELAEQARRFAPGLVVCGGERRRRRRRGYRRRGRIRRGLRRGRERRADRRRE